MLVVNLASEQLPCKCMDMLLAVTFSLVKGVHSGQLVYQENTKEEVHGTISHPVTEFYLCEPIITAARLHLPFPSTGKV